MMARARRLALGYARVSTAGQAAEGVSLDAQKERIGAWAQANGLALLAVHVDAGLSGGRADNRPELQKALGAACKRKAVLVVYSLSRLARSTKDTILIGERLAKAGADLVSLSESIDTTTAAGKMIFRLLAVLAEFERDLVSERTTAALHYKRAAGERTGGVPYGFDLASDGIRLVPNGKEQGIVKRVLAERAGGQSMRAIARGLAEDGVPTKNGGQWTPVQVSSILSRTAALDPGKAGV